MYVLDSFDCIRYRTKFRAEALIVADTIPGACVWLEV